MTFITIPLTGINCHRPIIFRDLAAAGKGYRYINTLGWIKTRVKEVENELVF